MHSLKDSKIIVLGATGFLGSAVCCRLQAAGVPHFEASLSLGVDFRDYGQIKEAFERTRPDVVLNCAAYVGGIQFAYEHSISIFNNNLLMTVNIYRVCDEYRIQRLVNPISNCIYPSKARVFKEDEVWDGPLDESVLVYGMARKMHWVGAWAYRQEKGLDVINLVFPNMYGPGDHFDPVRSHALGALIAKIVKAKQNDEPRVIIWGTGTPVREWLYIDDGAAAMIGAVSVESYAGLINVGCGTGVSIIELAEMIKREVGYKGKLELDPSRPDGAPHKTLDGSRAKQLLNWEPSYSLELGLRQTIERFVSDHSRGK